MYKVQLINTFNQEILREASYSNNLDIKRMIMGFEKAGEIQEPSLIFCNKKKTWIAEYLFHKIVQEKDITVYKLYFIVSLSEVQATITD